MELDDQLKLAHLLLEERLAGVKAAKAKLEEQIKRDSEESPNENI